MLFDVCPQLAVFECSSFVHPCATCCYCCCVLLQMPEFHQRVGVLQQLGYVSPDGTVTLKGRAACEINSTQVRWHVFTAAQ